MSRPHHEFSRCSKCQQVKKVGEEISIHRRGGGWVISTVCTECREARRRGLEVPVGRLVLTLKEAGARSGGSRLKLPDELLPPGERKDKTSPFAKAQLIVEKETGLAMAVWTKQEHEQHTEIMKALAGVDE